LFANAHNRMWRPEGQVLKEGPADDASMLITDNGAERLRQTLVRRQGNGRPGTR
jgi:hypothetical protein